MPPLPDNNVFNNFLLSYHLWSGYGGNKNYTIPPSRISQSYRETDKKIVFAIHCDQNCDGGCTGALRVLMRHLVQPGGVRKGFLEEEISELICKGY